QIHHLNEVVQQLSDKDAKIKKLKSSNKLLRHTNERLSVHVGEMIWRVTQEQISNLGPDEIFSSKYTRDGLDWFLSLGNKAEQGIMLFLHTGHTIEDSPMALVVEWTVFVCNSKLGVRSTRAAVKKFTRRLGEGLPLFTGMTVDQILAEDSGYVFED